MRVRRSVLAILIVVAAGGMSMYFSYNFLQKTININILNENLVVENIKFGMTEDDVIQRWGPGEHIPGFGGHAREYKDKGIRIGFPGDSDNDLYGKVGQLEFSNPEFSIFAVQVGDDREEAASRLTSRRFTPVEGADDIFVNGEFSVALRGNEKIDYIQIWFIDKDLRDRIY